MFDRKVSAWLPAGRVTGIAPPGASADWQGSGNCAAAARQRSALDVRRHGRVQSLPPPASVPRTAGRSRSFGGTPPPAWVTGRRKVPAEPDDYQLVAMRRTARKRLTGRSGRGDIRPPLTAWLRVLRALPDIVAAGPVSGSRPDGRQERLWVDGTVDYVDGWQPLVPWPRLTAGLRTTPCQQISQRSGPVAVDAERIPLPVRRLHRPDHEHDVPDAGPGDDLGRGPQLGRRGRRTRAHRVRLTLLIRSPPLTGP